MRNFIATALLLLSMQAHAGIVYDVTFTGLNTNAVGGVGVVTFGDTAFDAGGVFDSSAGLIDINVMLDGFSFEIADMLFSSTVDYEVQGGELTGFDWSANANVALLFGGSPDANIASTIGSTMNLFSLGAPCSAGTCSYAQYWVRQGGIVAVSEPGSWLLMGVGIFALMFRRRV